MKFDLKKTIRVAILIGMIIYGYFYGDDGTLNKVLQTILSTFGGP